MTDLDADLIAARQGDWAGRSALLRAGLATWAGGRLKFTPKGLRRLAELGVRLGR